MHVQNREGSITLDSWRMEGSAPPAAQPTLRPLEKRCPTWRRYNQFLAEETKQKWTWAKRNAKELALLQEVPPYIFCEHTYFPAMWQPTIPAKKNHHRAHLC